MNQNGAQKGNVQSNDFWDNFGQKRTPSNSASMTSMSANNQVNSFTNGPSRSANSCFVFIKFVFIRLHLRILMIIPMGGIILVIGVNQLKILQKWSKRKNKILGANLKTGYLTRNQLRKKIESKTLAISKSKKYQNCPQGKYKLFIFLLQSSFLVIS